MNDKPDWETTALERRQSLPLCGGVGGKIVCVSGKLWVTQENDSRDIILGPGQVFTIDRRGLTLIHATQRSVVRVQNVGQSSVRDCLEAAARRMRAALFADLWRRLRTRVLGMAS